jgi:hypothetical protein
MIVLLFSCLNASNNSSETQSESTVVESPSAKGTVKVSLFDASSPLQRPEVTIDLWPEGLLQSLSNPEEVIGVSNLLRAPCLEEYQSGISLAESVVNGQCLKSMKWVEFVDGHLNTESVDDILFQYALTGPYWGNGLDGTVVFVHHNAPEIPSVLSRMHQLTTQVTVVQHLNSKVQSVLQCNGQNMSKSDTVSLDKCNTIDVTDTAMSVYTSFVSSDYSNSSPVWMLNGYLVRGLQSARMLQHYQQYP